jgi:hypothetical protein
VKAGIFGADRALPARPDRPAPAFGFVGRIDSGMELPSAGWYQSRTNRTRVLCLFLRSRRAAPSPRWSRAHYRGTEGEAPLRPDFSVRPDYAKCLAMIVVGSTTVDAVAGESITELTRSTVFPWKVTAPMWANALP